MAAFVLVHSPIVGPFTWELVAEELRSQGHRVLVPELPYQKDPPTFFWKIHSGAIAEQIRPFSSDNPFILAGHSGAGLLLPSVRQASNRRPGAYIFVDADIPEDGRSRLDLLQQSLPQVAGEIKMALSGGAEVPSWSETDLMEIIPDARIRSRLLNEMRPHPLGFYTEPIPVFPGWPDAPCAYLSFSKTEGYEQSLERARHAGWATTELEGAHFHLLVDSQAVAGALLGLVEEIQAEDRGA